MNRQLKFRVYNPFYKKYWYFNIGDEIQEDDRNIFQQFTGIQDKNNNDIYEGDILNFTRINQTFIDLFDNKFNGYVFLT